MNTVQLETTARALVAAGKGVLAADESNNSCNKRFAAVNVPQDEEYRRKYRSLLLTTPEAVGILSGVIFYDETFWQTTGDNMPESELMRDYCAKNGIIPGIKLDEGLVDLEGFPDEQISKGLDTLAERVKKYADAGAQFAKWRSVIKISDHTPTDAAIAANAYIQARYARIVQEAGLVPMIEPEILFEGTHTQETAQAVLAHVLDVVFAACRTYRVHLPGAILKTSMVIPGKESGIPMDPQDVADRTAKVLQAHVPHELGGVVFLSGGQTPEQSFKNLDAIARKGPYPWGMTFSFSRALQDPVLKHWAENQEDIVGSKAIFAHQLKVAKEASMGQLNTEVMGGAFVSASQV